MSVDGATFDLLAARLFMVCSARASEVWATIADNPPPRAPPRCQTETQDKTLVYESFLSTGTRIPPQWTCRRRCRDRADIEPRCVSTETVFGGPAHRPTTVLGRPEKKKGDGPRKRRFGVRPKAPGRFMPTEASVGPCRDWTASRTPPLSAAFGTRFGFWPVSKA